MRPVRRGGKLARMEPTQRVTAARRAAIVWLAAAVIAADQLSKHWARTQLPAGKEVPLTSFFGWHYVLNPGAAFGWLRARPEVLTWVAIGATVVVFIAALRLRVWRPHLAAGLALVFGGAAGNLIDRFHAGHVTDFIDIHVGRFSWPEFNVADIGVSAGAILIAIYLYRGGPARAIETGTPADSDTAALATPDEETAGEATSEPSADTPLDAAALGSPGEAHALTDQG